MKSNIEIFLASNPTYFSLNMLTSENCAECIDPEGRMVHIVASDLQNVFIETIDC
jgi:hypothetical protein